MLKGAEWSQEAAAYLGNEIMDAALHTISQARELAPSVLKTEESEPNVETQNPTFPPRPNQQQPGEPAAAAGIPAAIYCTNAHQQYTSRHQWQMWVENVGALATRLFGTFWADPSNLRCTTFSRR